MNSGTCSATLLEASAQANQPSNEATSQPKHKAMKKKSKKKVRFKFKWGGARQNAILRQGENSAFNVFCAKGFNAKG
jgi:hypothetical protein